VQGHEISLADLRISYKLGGVVQQLASGCTTGDAAKNGSTENTGATLAHLDRYEADSDGDLIVLLDVSQDKTLLDEGLAREIVNRIQKLRKKVVANNVLF